jgi:hypothetical protein
MIVTLLFALTAAAQAAPAADATQSAAPPAKEKRVCRSVGLTGTNLRKRECHTEAEWAEINLANERNAKITKGEGRSTY